MSGMGDDQSDSSLPTEALIGICVGGGVVLISCLLFTCVCVVCCIWRNRRKQSLTINHEQGDGGQGDTRDYRNDSQADSTPSSAVSTLRHSVTTRLLSFTSRGRKAPPPISRDSDLTTKMTPDNSNPLYNSTSIAYISSNDRQQQTQIAETPLSGPNPALLSTSPRRHSLGYVEMQSAGRALPGIAASHSVGDIAESIKYDSVRDQGSYTIPYAAPSITPPQENPLLISVSAVRDVILRPTGPTTTTTTSSSSSSSSHPHTSTNQNHKVGGQRKDKKKEKESEKKKLQEEEDCGGEDEYVDPKLFLEDQEKIQQEEEVFDMENGPAKSKFLVTHNSAYTSPPTGDDPLLNDGPSPSYQNIQPSDETYLSDSYEHVNEFLSDDMDSHDRATLLAVTSEEKEKSKTAPSTPQRYPDSAAAPLGNSRLGPGIKGAHSVDNGRKLSIDNQYVEVVSPSRKSKSMKVQSKVNQKEELMSPTEVDYQNVVPETEVWGRGNVSRSMENLHTTSSDRVQSSSPGERQEGKQTKTPSPTPRTNSSPKPKPKKKPHPSPAKPHPLSTKPHSQSSDPVKQSVSTNQMRIVGGQSASQGQQRTKPSHHEVITIPAANGNLVTHSNGDSQLNPVTMDSNNEKGSEREVEEDEGGEVLYVNVGETLDEGGELYENINHLT